MFLKHLLGVIFHPLSNMKILSLNCQGLGILEVRSRTVEELHCLAREKCPKILFFWSETRLDMDGFFCRLKKELELTAGFVVSVIGSSGGLALLWADSVDLDILIFSSRHIDAIINQ